MYVEEKEVRENVPRTRMFEFNSQIDRKYNVMKYLFFCILLSFCAVPSLANAESHAVSHPLDRNLLVLFHTWQVTDGLTLFCDVSLLRQKGGPGDSSLRVFKGDKKIFSITPYQVPVSMFSTSDSASNLVTVWISGDGSYIVKVFAYKKGKVVQVLDAASAWMPEFVHVETGGRQDNQSIMVSEDGWVKDPVSDEMIKKPVSVDVYIWQGEEYKVVKKIPWGSRFEILKSRP